MSSNSIMEIIEKTPLIESGGKTFAVLTPKNKDVDTKNIISPATSRDSEVELNNAAEIPILLTSSRVESSEISSSQVMSTNTAMESIEISANAGTECYESTSEENSIKTAPGYKKYVDSNGKEVMSRTSYLSFICYICKKIFRLKLPCVKHLLVEHQIEVKEIKLPGPQPNVMKEKVKCPRCDKMFSKKNNLYRHIRNFHKGDGLEETNQVLPESEMPISCPVCSKGFNTFGGVNRHIRRYHAYEFDPEFYSSDDMIPCKLCEMRFRTEDALSKHLKDFHHVAGVVANIGIEGLKEDYFECDVCNLRIKDPSELRKHIGLEHGKFDFPVEILSDNEDNEETNRIFNCDECRSFFRTEQEWRTHIKEVHNAFPDSCCRRCGKIFNTYHDLKFHFKDVHFFTIPEHMHSLAPVHRVGADMGLSRSVWVAMEKIPKWLVKHAGGQLLLVVHKDEGSSSTYLKNEKKKSEN
ncbi:Zinc finger and BTB domain-containing protein 17 [Frankliniella fusca]|uniref:Zinc finger and BTB domain-containing protein 17 n=1 Tax=Frankliniella fusca TaxID=407009 RepID=A0AAE1LQQ3_9NEOP|nr:Zinc finger and BTB domain-containing protein 17 [Frankliniella fusca]